jgi:hypothetical protein
VLRIEYLFEALHIKKVQVKNKQTSFIEKEKLVAFMKKVIFVVSFFGSAIVLLQC